MFKNKKILIMMILVLGGLLSGTKSFADNFNSIESNISESVEVRFIENEGDRPTSSEMENLMKQDYNKNLKIQPMNRTVYATTIYVFLTRSGNTKTVWIDMGWTGNMRVNAIKFNSFSFTNGSSLNLVTYKKYNATTRNANTQTTGSFTLGSMLVPTGTNRVKGKTSGLMVYSANSGNWVSAVAIDTWASIN